MQICWIFLLFFVRLSFFHRIFAPCDIKPFTGKNVKPTKQQEISTPLIRERTTDMKHYINPFLMTMMLTMGVGTSAVAQGYYDDDIYYDASKSKTATTTQTTQSTQTTRATSGSATNITALPGSDTYVVVSNNTRNVDEYNRRGNYKPVSNSSTVDSLGENFQYTRRLERFYNSDIVTGSDDADLQYYYNYADDELADANCSSPATINIYVDNTDPWDNYWSPYYYSSAWSWATAPAYYNPWWRWNYAWGYGPSWSWSWGFAPAWSLSCGWDGWGFSWGLSWGWSPTWGWNPPHHHMGFDWGHGHNGWAHQPVRPSNFGAWRSTARPTANLAGGRPGVGNNRSTRLMGNNVRPTAGTSLRGSEMNGNRSFTGRTQSARPTGNTNGTHLGSGTSVRPTGSTRSTSGTRMTNGTGTSVRPTGTTNRQISGSTGSYGGGSYNPSNATRNTNNGGLRGTSGSSSRSTMGGSSNSSRSTGVRSSNTSSSSSRVSSGSNSGSSMRSSGGSTGGSRGTSGGGSRSTGGGSRGGRH
jgi:hypothetical protein